MCFFFPAIFHCSAAHPNKQWGLYSWHSLTTGHRVPAHTFTPRLALFLFHTHVSFSSALCLSAEFLLNSSLWFSSNGFLYGHVPLFPFVCISRAWKQNYAILHDHKWYSWSNLMKPLPHVLSQSVCVCVCLGTACSIAPNCLWPKTLANFRWVRTQHLCPQICLTSYCSLTKLGAFKLTKPFFLDYYQPFLGLCFHAKICPVASKKMCTHL